MKNHLPDTRLPNLKQVFLVLFFTFILTFSIGIIGALLGARTGLFLLEFFIIFPALIFVIAKKYSFVELFRLKPVSKQVIGISVIIGIAFSIVSDEVDRLIQILIPMPEIWKQAMETALKIQTSSDLIIIIFSAVFMAATLEEMLFRGFVQVSFENTFDVTKAIMAAAVIFAIVHLNPFWTIQYTLFGIILGVMAWKSNSIIPSMIVHLINNGLALIFMNSSPKTIDWYFYKDHVNFPIIIVALILTVFGFKWFYKYCDKMMENNVKRSNKQTPKVRIGVLQSSDQVSFQCNTMFSLRDANDRLLFTGAADTLYTLDIASSQPAKLRYQLRAAITKDRSEAEELIEQFKSEGLFGEIREVGISMQIGKRTIDNREYWVAIGDFARREEALSFRQTRENPGDFVVIEKILTPATGEIKLNGTKYGSTVRIVPTEETETTHITVSNIIIGIEFHWQKREDLDYRGIVEVGFNNQGKLVVINEIDIENYLTSVNSSEMTSDCPLGLLEAQTVVARSTVFATMGKHHYNTNFHLCSDDHCQCYHGKKREQNPSRQAVENTWGEVIMYGNEVCDARYSKICGGIIESYHNVWENRKIPYMMSAIDSEKPLEFPANTEAKAKKLIDSEPDCYCNTNLYQLPPKLANLYSTENLFRWTVEYQRQDLEKLIAQKTGEDIGELQDIVPLERGDSGRLIYINLVGSKKTLKIGKELEIRRVLSKSHLYSSMFYVKKETAPDGKVEKFILKGGGWGHGVGLCQVGATVMAMKNIPYPKILKHYYRNIDLIKLY